MGDHGQSGGALSGKRRAVFLDRDGVINRALVCDAKPYPPATLEEFEVLPGMAEALRALDEAGFLLIVATNNILNKLSLLGKDHVDYSLETVEMFYKDASAAGYTISCAKRAVSA
jgi:histidinol phosphatase-like enzyme